MITGGPEGGGLQGVPLLYISVPSTEPRIPGAFTLVRRNDWYAYPGRILRRSGDGGGEMKMASGGLEDEADGCGTRGPAGATKRLCGCVKTKERRGQQEQSGTRLRPTI
eukprot:221393-Prorocentrum_minimum.AAC.1